MKQDFQKIKLAIKYRLIGRADENPEWILSLEAYEFGKRHHVGLRKDGVTPEYQHQLSQANFVMTLAPFLLYPVETIATIFLHDVVEDCDVPLSEIRARFGERVAGAVEKMTNRFESGQKKETAAYYLSMVNCPIASVCKGADRGHNHQSMPGVVAFPPEKQLRYIAETREHILPMLAEARRNFPRQERAYENIKHLLQTQCELLQYAHTGGVTNA